MHLSLASSARPGSQNFCLSRGDACAVLCSLYACCPCKSLLGSIEKAASSLLDESGVAGPSCLIFRSSIAFQVVCASTNAVVVLAAAFNVESIAVSALFNCTANGHGILCVPLTSAVGQSKRPWPCSCATWAQLAFSICRKST
jgi:hypothetical protein